jgi:alanyl aminopeptidase
MPTVLPLAVLAAGALAPAATPTPPLRLPDTVRPTHVAVELRLDPRDETFSGTVDIDVELREPLTRIWLNGVDLTVDEATLRTGTDTMTARPVTAAGDRLGFELERAAPAGRAVLHAAYTGKVDSRNSAGIFRNKDGDDWYLYTQFESIDARRAFPCFDEPSYKVPWQITVRVPKDMMALSNTPVLSERDEGDGTKVVAFSETKPLPSYLVAFAVGPFEAVDAGRVGRKQTPLRIIVPRGRSGEAKYAKEVTGQILDRLESYFGTPYPYRKLDSIAVPLFGGAMENPGLITYAQTLILAPPGEDDLRRQRGYAETAAHEMAHLWFGDLVTTAWWNDIWLNEAFATWLSSRIVEDWRPEWKEDLRAAAARERSMGNDSLVSARMIRQPVESRDDIANAFDNITYEKGAAVIYMFEHWIGPEAFRKGVQAYMARHAWGNATASDFLRAVGEGAGRDVAPAFSTFLDQAGVPLLSATLRCADGAPTVQVRQKRYLPLGSPPPDRRAWQVPVCYRYGDAGDETRGCALVGAPEVDVPIRAARSCPAWLLLNAGESGYYRVRYETSLRQRLLADGGRRLSPAERIGVMADAQALFKSGDLPAAEALELVPAFANDPSRQVVAGALTFVRDLDAHMVPDELRPNYRRFIERTFGDRARRLGWRPRPDEDDDMRLLRPALVGLVANQGEDEALVAEAGRLTAEWFGDHGVLPPDVTGLVLSTAARRGDRALFDRFVSALRATHEEREREWLLGALGSFRDPAMVEAGFQLFLSGELDPRESLGLLFGPLRDARTQTLPYGLIIGDYAKVAAALPSFAGFDLAAYLPFVATGFCDAAHRAEAEAFFKERSATAQGGPRLLAQALETVGQCAALRAAQGSSVSEFLKGY